LLKVGPEVVVVVTAYLGAATMGASLDLMEVEEEEASRTLGAKAKKERLDR